MRWSRRNTSNVNSPSKSAAWTIATFNVCVCKFGVSLYRSMASMPLSRFTPHHIRGQRFHRTTEREAIWHFRRMGLGVEICYFRQLPPSTGSVTPVM